MTKIEKLITVAIAKGVIHAAVIPVVVFYLTNYFVKGNWGGISAFVYILLLSATYLVMKNRDISKFTYFWTLVIVYGGWIATILVSAIFAGLGGSY